jgi:hypothetical protein
MNSNVARDRLDLKVASALRGCVSSVHGTTEGVSMEDEQSFVSLRDALATENIAIGTLATAIEKEGIWTWDRFGRRGLADSIAKEKALQLLADQYAWELIQDDPDTDTLSPLDSNDGPQDYFWRFGWPASSLPDFEVIGKDVDLGRPPATKKPSPIPELTNLRIIGALITLMLDKSPAGNPYSAFETEAAIISVLEETFPHLRGIGERTLHHRFAKGKRSLTSD